MTPPKKLLCLKNKLCRKNEGYEHQWKAGEKHKIFKKNKLLRSLETEITFFHNNLNNIIK